MRRYLLLIGVALAAVCAVPLTALATNSPAQIVNCAASTWCDSPNPIQITTGTTVTWANMTGAPHTATADNGAWNTGTIASGQTSAAIIFNTPGTFAYHCSFHSFMHGRIAVTAATTTSPSPTAHATTAPTVHALAHSGGGPTGPFVALLGGLAVLLGMAIVLGGGLRRRWY